MPAKPAVSRTILSDHRTPVRERSIDHIVVHYTNSRNIDGVIQHFLTGSPEVSAHYVVGQDGELVQMVPDDAVAWHAGSRDMNHRSIGIEHCAEPGDRMTPEQERTSAALIRWLMATYAIPADNIIPHVTVKPTDCPGDLFAAWGGKAGAPSPEQEAALSAWLKERVLAKPQPEPVAAERKPAMTETVSETAPVPEPKPKPATSSVTVWGGLTSAAGAIAMIANIFGIPLTAEMVSVLMSAVGVVMTLFGRLHADSPLGGVFKA